MGVRDWWGWTPLCIGGLLALSWRERRRAEKDDEVGQLRVRVELAEGRIAELAALAPRVEWHWWHVPIEYGNSTGGVVLDGPT